MTIRVQNTLTGRKEELVPLGDGPVRIYVCGVTPYAETHIGHARPSVFWDVVRRYLEYRGYKVFLVQNFTDIDDKVIARAQATGEDPLAISRRYSQEYLRLMGLLGVRPADVYPRVSDHIGDIVKVIQGLIERGNAYERKGNVWFDVTTFPRYGRLSRRSLDELRAGARVEVDPDKRNPADFAVWKRAKPGEPAWPSPWGPGRPGWHIECSVMALKYLGSGLDFHGGGTDLIFPHHENEIAQSEAYTGETFCRFWVHHEMLNLRGEKMSKSLGNVVTCAEVLDRAPSGAVRLLLLGAHYRKPLDFDFDLLEENKRAWRRLNEAARRLREAAGGAVRLEGGADEALAEAARAARRRFEEAMDDDFNTAEALGSLFDLVRAANSALAGPSGPGPGPESGRDRSLATERPEEGPPAASGEGVRLALAVLEELGGEILGLVRPPGERDAPEAGPADELVSLLLEVRSRLREKKDFALADLIREELVRLGYEVQDGPRGSVARRRD